MAAEDGDEEAHRALLGIITRFVARKVPDPDSTPSWFEDLCHALRADGYELTWDCIVEETAPIPFDGHHEKVGIRSKNHPTDATSARLGPEISGLEGSCFGEPTT